MEKDDLANLIENNTTEMKLARGGIPRSVYETFSSFANTDGGTVYLGVEEGDPNVLSGLSKKTCETYKKELLDTVQNASKISHVVFKDEDIEEIKIGEDQFVLAIRVKEADRFSKPVYLNGNLSQAYTRNGEGDFLLRQEQLTSYLYDANLRDGDSLANSAGLTFEDINLPTLKEYRRCMDEYSSSNIYRELSDEEFLRKTGMLKKSEKGAEMLSNAAVILFTSSPLIEMVYPHYVLDYQRKDSPGLKWDERIASDDPSWSGNAFDFYLLVLKAIAPYIPSAYVGEENRNNGPRLMSDAIKEILVNALSNHAFLLNGSLEFIRYPTSLSVSNNGKMLVGSAQALRGGISNPRNPSIMAAFRRIGASDRAGTGVPKIETALEKNGYPPLLLEESSDPVDKTKLTISFVSLANSKAKAKLKELVSVLSAHRLPLSSGELMALTGWSRTTIALLLKDGIQRGIIKDNGKEKKAKRYFLA